MSASSRHPLRRAKRRAAPGRTGMREDISFFLVSFAAAFVIFYGFIV